MGDRITLRGLRVFGHHGVLEAERVDGQTFVVDVEVVADLSAAAATDDLTATIDYSAMADAVVAAVATDPVDLIETVAVRVADTVLTGFGVDEVTVTIHKPDAPIAHPFDDVAVTVTRHR